MDQLVSTNQRAPPLRTVIVVGAEDYLPRQPVADGSKIEITEIF